jgi:single-strand DNA-binding protein
MNSIVAIGRITKDLELKTTKNGTTVISFDLADQRPYKQDGVQETDFLHCVAWRATAEFIARNCRKGVRIAVQGRLQMRRYEDRDGNKREIAEIQVEHVDFADGKIDGKQEGPAQQTTPPVYEGDSSGFEELANDDELPF